MKKIIFSAVAFAVIAVAAVVAIPNTAEASAGWANNQPFVGSTLSTLHNHGPTVSIFSHSADSFTLVTASNMKSVAGYPGTHVGAISLKSVVALNSAYSVLAYAGPMPEV